MKNLICYITRKLSYRKDDRTMHPIYECPEDFWEPATTPTATYCRSNALHSSIGQNRILVSNIRYLVSVLRPECDKLSVFSRSQILTDFDEIWHRHPEPEKKEPFRRGSKSNKSIPNVYPILPQIGTHIMHFIFQWET